MTLGGDGLDGEFAVEEVPELDAGGSVGAFDAAVPLGASRRQDAEFDAELLAGVLELGHELAAAVDLDGLQAASPPPLEYVSLRVQSTVAVE